MEEKNSTNTIIHRPMKFRILLLLLCAASLAACSSRRIVVPLEGCVALNTSSGRSVGRLSGGKTDTLYPVVRGIPAEWRQAEVYFADDFPQVLYQGFRQGRVSEEFCMRYFEAWGRDTADCSARSLRAWIAFAAGVAPDGRFAYRVDSDGDDDLSDEPTSYFAADSASSVSTAVYVERYAGGAIHPDTVHIHPFRRYWGMCIAYDDLRRGSFWTGDDYYTVHVKPVSDTYRDGTLRFEGPDTVEIEATDRFVRLSGVMHRIDSLRFDGRELRLTRCPEESDPCVLQPGFRPFPFEAETLDGRRIRFPDDFAGRYVLLDFWAIGCGPCRAEIERTLRPCYDRFRDAGFEIVGVADDSAADLDEWVPASAIAWPIVADRPDKRVQKLYGVRGYPTLLLVGPDGRIVSRDDGDLRGSRLAATLEKLLGAPQR